MKDESYRNKVLPKIAKSLYINGTGKCSKYQKYLCDIVNGKLNYPVDNCLLDIAFPDKMIYIEYNGGGHYVYHPIDEINKHDMKRQYFLKNKGWKLIKIISINNKELDDEIILKLIHIGEPYLLDTSHSWIEIDIDNMLIKCKEYIKYINNVIKD